MAGSDVQSSARLLPTYTSDQYTLVSLGGVIFEHTQSQERKRTAAPIVPNTQTQEMCDWSHVAWHGSRSWLP